MTHNLFIALEGIDGSGKSTQTRALTGRMEAEGYNVYSTFEPSSGQVGTLLRSILKGTTKADQRTIAGLFLADRLDHLLNETNGVVKKLEEGYTVITDRYYFSSYAYHAVHMDMNWVIDANRLCAEILRPHITLFIDVSPETAMDRINATRDGTELYETLENLQKVRNNYFEAFEKTKEKENIVVIDGNQPPEVVSENIWIAIKGHLPGK